MEIDHHPHSVQHLVRILPFAPSALSHCLNPSVLFLLVCSAYAVVLAVERDALKTENDGWLRENELSLVMNGIGNVYQHLFNFVAMVEAYHPATEMKWMLARYRFLCQDVPI